jgi:hypothetical protein
VFNKYVFGAMNLSPLATFALSIAFGLPMVLALCYGFHLMFEAPFLRNRGWSALRTMPMLRLWGQRRRDAEEQSATTGELYGPSPVSSPKPSTGEQQAVG